jgi:hypothetical protein
VLIERRTDFGVEMMNVAECQQLRCIARFDVLVELGENFMKHFTNGSVFGEIFVTSLKLPGETCVVFRGVASLDGSSKAACSEAPAIETNETLGACPDECVAASPISEDERVAMH